jgi:DNA replication and repair protein RecF
VQWRNVEDGEFEFSPRVNVLLGANGQGKTNFLEAVQYLALGRSHRGSRDDEIVRFGADHFFVRGVGEGDAGESFSIEAGFTPPRSKRLRVDQQPLQRLTDLLGVLACVSFGPEDSELVRGGPQFRRRYVDYSLAETSRSSLTLLSEYRRSVQQRTAWLRDGRRSDAELERGLAVWDDEQVRLGCQVVARRAEALADLAPRAAVVFAQLTDGISLRLRYAVHAAGRTFDVGGRSGSAAVAASVPDLLGMQADGALAAAFRARLRERRAAERARGVSLVGPHRDDVELEAGGRDLRRFGSQGQCRAAAVALKMAQAEFIAERRHEQPVVVLDDVFAEFDEARARSLWDAVCERHQTFLAVPRRSDLELGRAGAVFRVESGRVTRET